MLPCKLCEVGGTKKRGGKDCKRRRYRRGEGKREKEGK